jgi:hypothetical protein
MTTWTNTFKHPIDYLLIESSSFLLLETGDKIMLEQTGNSTSLWSQSSKN